MAKAKDPRNYYPVEEGIPIPQARQYAISHKKNVYPFPEMRVGDSFLAPTGSNPHQVLQAGIAFSRRRAAKMKFTVRRTEDGCTRCWRIE